MTSPIHPAALDPDTLRLAEGGAHEIFKTALVDMIEAMHLAGEEFDQEDLGTLVLAGQMAEEADRRDNRQK